MAEFQFKNSQRVIVPREISGAFGVQAVVVAATDHLGREPEYKLQWPDAGMMQENQQLVACHAVIAESELLKVQPAKGTVELKVEVDQTSLDSALSKARALKKLTAHGKAVSKSKRRSR
jgi:phage terminase small subunit